MVAIAKAKEKSPHTGETTTPKRFSDLHKVAVQSLAKLGVTAAQIKQNLGVWSKRTTITTKAAFIVDLLGLLREAGAQDGVSEQQADQSDAPS